MGLKTVGLVVTLTLIILTAPLAADAQEAMKVYRIGRLSAGSPGLESNAREEAFRQGLRELGYIEGQTLVLEYRSAERSMRPRARRAPSRS
jgi:putative ABC transport system substrate-binding protein